MKKKTVITCQDKHDHTVEKNKKRKNQNDKEDFERQVQ